MLLEHRERDVLKILKRRGSIDPVYVEEEESGTLLSKEEIRVALYSLCSKGVVELNHELKLVLKKKY